MIYSKEIMEELAPLEKDLEYIYRTKTKTKIFTKEQCEKVYNAYNITLNSWEAKVHYPINCPTCVFKCFYRVAETYFNTLNENDKEKNNPSDGEGEGQEARDKNSSPKRGRPKGHSKVPTETVPTE